MNELAQDTIINLAAVAWFIIAVSLFVHFGQPKPTGKRVVFWFMCAGPLGWMVVGIVLVWFTWSAFNRWLDKP